MKQNICLGVTALLLVGGLLLPPRTEAATISNETLTNAIEKVLQEQSWILPNKVPICGENITLRHNGKKT